MSLTRADIEARERDTLAPYAMRAANSRGRDHAADKDPYRTEFQRDRDRIVHSRAFRRLAYKTQVFANDQGDLLRTRLTHTMEVSQLARTLARRLRLNEDLTECIACCHDLGHPPFGHRGEAMLDELMQDSGGFDHHRQALRLIEELEVRYPHFNGLDLTYEVRESIIKHGDGVGEAVPLRFRPREARLLEARLVDEVDSIVYDCHDLDDALRTGIIDLPQLQELDLWRGAWEEAASSIPAASSRKLQVDLCLRILLDALASDLVEASQRRLEQAGLGDEQAVRACNEPLVAVSASMQPAKQQLEEWLFVSVYRDWRVNRTFHKARRLLVELFEYFRVHPDSLPGEHQDRIETAGLDRTVADYLAGMTDRYVIDEHQRLFSPGRRAW